MLVIGNKKYRNLQEQVGWNTEQIDKIFEFLDGINVSDNVVVVGDISTPLTAEELEIVNREVAFIVYNGELYFKKNQDSSYIYFDIIFQVTSGTVITLTSSEIAVTKSNGALGITNSTDYVYSKTQIDTLLSAKADLTYLNNQLALKANLAGANFTGAITSPSIIEDMIGYTFEKDVNSDIELRYAGVCKNGNKITFVLFGTFTPTSDYGSNLIPIGRFQIPASVGAKLYPYSQSWVSSMLASQQIKFYSGLILGANVEAYCIKNNNQEISFQMAESTSLTLNTTYIFRIEQTFLLSDNLAS